MTKLWLPDLEGRFNFFKNNLNNWDTYVLKHVGKRSAKIGSLLSKSLQLASVSIAIFDWSKLLEEFLWNSDRQKGYILIILKSR